MNAALLKVFVRRRISMVALGIGLAAAAAAGVPWISAMGHVRTARALLERGEISPALAHLKAAERWRPQRAEIMYLLARAYRRSGDIDRMDVYLRRAAELGWPDPDLHRERQLLLIQSGRSNEAQAFLDRVLTAGAGDDLAEEVYEAQAKGFLATFRLNDAIVCLNFWIQWRPAAVQPRLWLADVWQRCDRWQAATDEYRRILQIDGNCHEAHLKLAENLLRLNDVQGAFQQYQQCLAQNADDENVLLGAARCRRRQGEPEDAERRMRRLLDRPLSSTVRAAALVELAQLSLDARRPEESRELLEEALRLEPRNQPANSTLAVTCARLDRPDLAEHYRHESEQITQHYDRLTEITRLLSESPGDADLRFEAGSILMQEGLPDAGATWMATALLYDRRHQATHRALAAHFQELGDAERAARHRHMLKSSESTDPDRQMSNGAPVSQE
jgi:tetratricopeptide (TPR) repeat protein